MARRRCSCDRVCGKDRSAAIGRCATPWNSIDIPSSFWARELAAREAGDYRRNNSMYTSVMNKTCYGRQDIDATADFGVDPGRDCGGQAIDAAAGFQILPSSPTQSGSHTISLSCPLFPLLTLTYTPLFPLLTPPPSLLISLQA